MRYHLNSFNPDSEGLNINLLIVNHKLSNIYIKQKILEKYLYTEVTTIGYISDLLYILHNQMTGIKKNGWNTKNYMTQNTFKKKDDLLNSFHNQILAHKKWL